MWGWRIWDKEKRFLFLSSMDLFFLHISSYIHLPLASLKSSRSATQKEIILAELLAFFNRLCFPSTPCVLIVVETVALWKACVYHTRKYPRAISYQRWIRNAEPRLTWTELFLSQGLLLSWGHHDPASWSLYIFLDAHFSVHLQGKFTEVVLLNQNKYTF